MMCVLNFYKKIPSNNNYDFYKKNHIRIVSV